MDNANKRILGLVFLVVGLGLALTFGGNRGFSGTVYAGLAYIGGFVLAFIGAYMLFIAGRTRSNAE